MKSPEEYTDENALSSNSDGAPGRFAAGALQDGMPSALQNEMPSGKVLLLGEQNPYGGDPSYALYPAPDGCAGHRLCRLVLDLPRTEYLRRFDRRNVLERPGKWSVREARNEASLILGAHRRVVALGAKVAAALGLSTEPFSMHEILLHGEEERLVLVLPHPSGLCRAWNVPGAFERARKMVSELEARR